MFSHTGTTVILHDVHLSYDEFKFLEPEYPTLPKGVKERRYSERGLVLIKRSGEEFVSSTWEEGDRYLANRYIYKAKLDKHKKSSSPGSVTLTHALALIEILLISDLHERAQTLGELNINPTPEDLWKALRQARNRLLSACDWTQLLDAPFTPEQKAQWAKYRQSLRNITQQGEPLTIEWPVPPSNINN